MASSTAPRPGQRYPLQGGPWPGARTVTDPYAAAFGFLYDARNGYIPDPKGRSGFFSRPGFTLLFDGDPLTTSGTPFRGQAVYAHTDPGGLTTNFVVQGGKVYRLDDTLSFGVDVTPVGVTIDDTITTRVEFRSLTEHLIVSDGVNRPWLATDLASTPITGTPIDFDGSGTAWSAFTTTIYGGSVFFALNEVGGVSARDDLAWCQPGDPATGYQQPDFDNRWTVEQTGGEPIYGLCGTNSGLYYWREAAIGKITGDVGPNLSTTATHDEVAFNVGTRAPQTIQLFGSTIFFCDAYGRPQMMRIGSAPVDIWQNMRGIVDTATIDAQLVTQITAVSAFEPLLNLYLVGIWSPHPASQASPTQLFAFDAKTGVYVGFWTIGGSETGIAIDAMGVLRDSAGHRVLVILGSKDPGTVLPSPANGFVWRLNTLLGTADVISTEDGIFITTEDGVPITTEGQSDLWKDNGQVPDIRCTTQQLGYTESGMWNVDQVTVISTSDAPVEVSVRTPSSALAVIGAPTPSLSQDGTYRAVAYADTYGRALEVTVRPTTADKQWSLQRIVASAVMSMAGPEDS